MSPDCARIGNVQRFFWDTNQYIYLFEANPAFYPAVAALRRQMILAKHELFTSALILGEIQVKALAAGNHALAADLKRRVQQSSQVLAFDEAASDAFAYIRSATGIKGADALNLSCAMAAGVDWFVTNDIDLHKVRLPGIGAITSASLL